MKSETVHFREQVNEYVSLRKQAIRNVVKERERFEEAEKKEAQLQEALYHIQKVSQTLQEQAHQAVSDVVTVCLKTIFHDRNYAFKLKFERKRSKTEAKPILISDGHEIENPMDEDSGGVVDVAAFACQVAAILSSKPSIRRFMGMDEPFKFVSPEYKDAVETLLQVLADDFDMQFFMVTSHKSQISVGKEILL